MRKLIYILVLLLSLTAISAAAHTYVSSSVLSSGTFVKIQVSESGLYSMSYSELRNLGLEPTTLRIYGYGGAQLSQNFTQTKIDDLPNVPYYTDGSRIIFFAQGNISWRYDGSRFVHTRNTYSDYGYYFLTSDHGTPVAFPTAPTSGGSPSLTLTSYTKLLLHENDSINLIDRSGSSGGGREFYGEQFTVGRKMQFTFPKDEYIVNDIHAYVDLAAKAGTTSQFILSSGGTTASCTHTAITSSDHYIMGTAAAISATLPHSIIPTLTLTFQSASATAVGFLNYIELSYETALDYHSQSSFMFRSSQGYGTSQVIRYEIANAPEDAIVWDISNRADIKRVITTRSGSTLSFNAANRTANEYVTFSPSTATFLHPTVIGPIGQQNLHALQNIDYVIITPAAFLSEAERLASAHAEVDGMTTAVVTDEQVYNEFSSGTPDATAYRWLLKMLYDRANTSHGSILPPRYLLLFGDGTFDNRKLLATSGNNILLPYQSKNSLNEVKAYATDDYFGFLDDTEGEVDIYGRMDISVGRMPVNTLAQASGVVDKLLRHMQTPNLGRWKNQVVFLADDGDHNLHTKGADVAGEALRVHNHDFIINKIYLDAYTQEVNASGEQYPLAQQKLTNMLNDGVLLFDYCGHSGYNNASSEGLISTAIVRQMQNENLGMWMFASCNFAQFDAGKVSAAEEAVLNSNGGALAICAASRTVYANQNETLNRHLCDSLFAHSSPFNYYNRVGDAVRLAKNACGSDENKMSYLLLGDPAASLHFPTEYQVMTTSISDTINALAVNEIGGYIQTEDGDTATWFNGKLSITIFDKLQQITTLDNDESSEDSKQRYTYNDYPNILFQGEVDITAGRFNYVFMTPKDIRYNYGNGRIVYYAYDTTSGEEGVGHYEDFIIGGSSTVEIIDSVGPELNIYLNTPAFVSGDNTNETPHFYAEIADEHGINTAGAGIGHDLLLIVDNQPTETYVLNDFFTARNNSYQAGTVSYRMKELSEGNHSLFFRAWDLLNNSSSKTIDFNVVKGLEPSIMSVISYPNPIPQDGTLNINIDYDRRDVTMQTDVYVTDLSGRLVYHISQHGTDNLRWDIGGSHVPAGMYIYKVQLSSPTTKTISKSGKLIITK